MREASVGDCGGRAITIWPDRVEVKPATAIARLPDSISLVVAKDATWTELAQPEGTWGFWSTETTPAAARLPHLTSAQVLVLYDVRSHLAPLRQHAESQVD